MGQFKRVREKKSLTETLQKRVNNVLTGKYKKVLKKGVLMRHYQVSKYLGVLRPVNHYGYIRAKRRYQKL